MPASRIPRTFTAAAASVGVTAAAPSLLRCLLVAALLSVGLRPVSAFSSLSECSSGLGPLPPANGSLLSHFYSNTAFAPSASQPYATNSTYAYSRSLAFRFPESLPASFPPAASLSSFSFQVHGHLRAEFDALYAFTCHYDSSELSVRLWLDDKLLCPSDANNVDLQLPFTAGQLLHLRMEVIQRGHWAPQPDPHLEVLWSSGLGVYTAIPSSALVGCLSTPRLQQLAMHERQLTTSGWDQLFNSDFLTQTLLPHSLALTVALYRLSTASFRKGLTPQRASNGLNSTSSFRIGNRTWVGDTGVPYQSLELLWEGLTLQLETTSNRSSNELTVLITGLSAANYSDYRIVIITSYLWGRLGNCTALDSQTPGQPFALCDTAGIAPAIPLYSSTAVASNQLPGVDSAALGGIAAFAFPEPSSQWAGPVLAFTTGSALPVDQSQRQIQAAAAVVAAAPCLPSPLQSVPSPPAEECQLIQTALAWLTIYTPYEGLILVVARDWDAGYGYVLFEWDSFFSVVMLASFDSAFAQQLAVATYVQMVKTSTLLPDGTGFVPNYASGPRQSRDRTEPPIAAKVLLEMLKAWGTDHPALQWVVPLCFPDLLRENGWFWAHRRAEPLLLITLGSDPNLPIGGDIDVNNLQAAMFESGLDNSPMYDGAGFDTSTHLMQLYDVGFTSLFLAGCQALQQIASLTGVGREAVPLLASRYDTMSPVAAAGLWNDSRGIFVNKRVPDGASVYRLSPTSFYPMMAELATLQQAETMVRLHLTNDEEFCVSQTCPGLPIPSIARNDPAYGDQHYWRGRQWGPHTMLVWWSLNADKYAGSEVVQQARRQLVAQAGQIWQQEWRAYRHVHENYNGNAPEGCNVGDSDPLYTWGALNPYVTILEQLRQAEKQKGRSQPQTE